MGANRLLWLSQATDQAVSKFFERIGGSVYDNPVKFLVIPALIAIACMAGFSNFREEFNAESLYTPQDAEAFGDREVIEANFGFGSRLDTIYAVGVPEGSVILTVANLLTFLDTFTFVTETMTESGGPEDEGTAINFTTVCYKTGSECQVKSILAFWDYNRTLIASRADAELMQDISDQGNQTRERNGQNLFLSEVASSDDNGEIVAFRMNFYLENNKRPLDDRADDDPRADEWEAERAELTPDFSGNLRYYSYNAALQRKASGAISQDLQLLIGGYILLILYAILVLSRGNAVHTHGTLAYASFAAVGLAILACYGLGSAFGIPFSGVVQTLSFLLLGIGMDDAFVLVAAFQETDLLDMHPKERVQKAMARAGASITVTSITDVVAFLIGSITDIPAIQAFCWYAAIGITFDFFLQTTFFVVLMIWSAQREEKNRYDWLCCVTASNPDKNCCSSKTFDAKDFEEPLTKFIRDKFAPALLHPAGKAVVLLITAVYLGASVYFITELEVNMDAEWFVPDGDALQDTFKIRDTYFGSNEVPTTIYTFDVDYTSATAQIELQAISSGLNSSSYYVENSCRNWWPSFLSFVQATNSSVVSNAVVDSNEFYTYFDLYYVNDVSDFVRDSLSLETNNGVRTIKGTKIPCRFKPNWDDSITKTDHEINAMDESRNIASRGPNLGRARAYSIPYVWWDGLKVVYEQILFNVVLALCAVLFVCMVLLGSVPAALSVFMMLVMIDVEVLGSYYYWGEQINYVTGIFLVIAVGLSVDACAHITHTFLDSDGSGNERAARALYIIGRSVLNGGISTMLVLLPLTMAQSYIFKVFFVCFFSIIGHSLWHGFFVLPVILSLVQPKSYSKIRDQLANQDSQFCEAKVNPTDDLAMIASQKERVQAEDASGNFSIQQKIVTKI